MNQHDAPELPRDDEVERDGIEEEDNPIPAWFQWSFSGTVLFGIIYILFYTLSGWSSRAQYEAEVEVAQKAQAAIQASLPSTNPFRANASAIAEGKEVWNTTCVACHKPDGSGLVGPSVVDPYWEIWNERC